MSSQSDPEELGPRRKSSLSTPAAYDNECFQLAPELPSESKQQALDDASNDCLSQRMHRRRSMSSSSTSTSRNSQRESQNSSTLESDGDSSDVAILRPRGKLASRLNAQGKKEPQGQTINGSSAYDRIKQQLLGKPTSPLADEPEHAAQEEQGLAVPSTGVMRKFLRRKKTKHVESEDGGSTSETLPTRDKEQMQSHAPVSKSPSAGAFSPTTPVPHSLEAAAKASSTIAPDDSDDLAENPLQNARFLALVARKREERKAREAEEEKKRKEREARHRPSVSALSDISDSDDNEDLAAGRKLTQQSKPTRKASKKAMEEMKRETQRISRNMQLAHEAKTKKKVTKDSFLDRFKFRRNDGPGGTNPSSSTVVSSLPGSDMERSNEHHTPPTSPERLGGSASTTKLNSTTEHTLAAPFETDNEFPIFEEILNSQSKDKGKGRAVEATLPPPSGMDDELPNYEEIISNQSKDKGKGKAVEKPLPEESKSKGPVFTQRPIKIRPPTNPVLPEGYAFASDSDLEIIPTKQPSSRKLNVFDRIPAKKAPEDQTRLKLRALAHLGSPSRLGPASKPSLNPIELQDSLRKRARQQAARERTERLQELRERGVIIQTAEERARDQETVEDMLERARREDEELTKQEKEVAKKERRENGEDDGLESSEDEDYQGDDEPEVDLSGSEEDDENNGDNEEEEDSAEGEGEADDILGTETAGVKSMIANEALEDEGEEWNDGGSGPADEIEPGLAFEDIPRATQVGRRGKRNQVVDDDENDSDTVNQPKPTSSYVGTQPIQNPFGQVAMSSGGPSMGLTQAFASTMVDIQTDEYAAGDGQDSLDALRTTSLPDFTAPEPDTLIADSQVGEGPDIDLNFAQSQTVRDSYTTDQPATQTQYSQIPDPTQDVGFEKFSPIGSRFAPVPPSTMDTVILPPENASPVLKKQGRLRRRGKAVTIFSDEDDMSPKRDAGFEISVSAFDVMKKAVKQGKQRDDFVKKTSEAKGMVEEQAEESEDEYAGLGGASDEDSEAEEDEEVQKLIDEEEIEVDERKMAAFYADKERVNDEKAVEKLFKDINSGFLRRKRGADFDLDDSDDDVEARRRRKRREFARMRQALLADSKVGKIAEDPKKLAFLRAIEDRSPDDEIDILCESENEWPRESQSQQPDGSQEVIPDSQAENREPGGAAGRGAPAPALAVGATLKRKRPLEEATPDPANRPPPHARRTIAARKPATLAEIRDSVSFLTEHPADADSPQPLLPSSDHEDDEWCERPNYAHPRRTQVIAPFIDRLSLKRADSAREAVEEGGRLAFHDASTAGPAGFRVPALLRRATSGFSTTANTVNEHGISTRGSAAAVAVTAGVATRLAGTERAAGGGEKGDFVRRGAGKRSGIGWFARRNGGAGEGFVEDVERRRGERRGRVLREGRKAGGVLGLLGGGKFE